MNEKVHDTRTATIVGVGSTAESIAGGAAIVLAIIGLANVLPGLLLPIATIALGAALLFEGGAIASRYSALLSETSKGQYQRMELGVGFSSELIGGLVGVVLGILALINVAPMVLMPIAAIVFGATLLFSSGTNIRLNHLQIAQYGELEEFMKVAREAVTASAAVQMFLGFGALTLGILAILGLSPMILTFVAFLSVGVSELLTGGSLGAKMVGAART